MLTFSHWHICISGFLQRHGKLNGMVALWSDLRGQFEDESTQVERCAWSDDFNDLAEFIWRLRPPNGQPRINIYGYSWGGYSATVLARELARRGLRVESLVLTDAVYRHNYWCGQWRAFVPWMRIVIPANVRRVTWFRQMANFPQGHQLIAADPDRTKISEAITLDDGTVHQYMDDHPDFQKVARDEALRLSA